MNRTTQAQEKGTRLCLCSCLCLCLLRTCKLAFSISGTTDQVIPHAVFCVACIAGVPVRFQARIRSRVGLGRGKASEGEDDQTAPSPSEAFFLAPVLLLNEPCLKRTRAPATQAIFCGGVLHGKSASQCCALAEMKRPCGYSYAYAQTWHCDRDVEAFSLFFLFCSFVRFLGFLSRAVYITGVSQDKPQARFEAGRQRGNV